MRKQKGGERVINPEGEEIVASVMISAMIVKVLDWTILRERMDSFQFWVITLLLANLLVNSLKECYYYRKYRAEMLKKDVTDKLCSDSGEYTEDRAGGIADTDM